MTNLPFEITLVIAGIAGLTIGWFLIFTLFIMGVRTRKEFLGRTLTHIASIGLGALFGYTGSSLTKVNGAILFLALAGAALGGLVGYRTGFSFHLRILKAESDYNEPILFGTPRKPEGDEKDANA